MKRVKPPKVRPDWEKLGVRAKKLNSKQFFQEIGRRLIKYKLWVINPKERKWKS